MEPWFLVFWSTFAAIALMEHLAPGREAMARRGMRWPTNIALGVINGLILSLAPALTVAAALIAQTNGTGLLNWLAAPGWVAVAATLLARSFAQYAFHVATHKVPVLWAVHRVHHCDRHVDVSTALRFHPFETVATLMFFPPLALALGLSPAAVAVYEIVELLFGLATHANVRVPAGLDAVLRVVLITPSAHQVHHSQDQQQTDTNYGAVVSIWDRMFGTYGTPDRANVLVPGLASIDEASAASLTTQIALPVRSGRPGEPR